MRSHYKRLGDLIHLVDERNKGLSVSLLLGLTISKKFIPSVANTIGTDMENYKIIRKNQFACSLMQVRRDKKIPVALVQEFDEAIISQAYPIFEVNDVKEILPEYLMMWFSREEFDRESCFYAVGGVRGSLEWEDFCNMQLPVPDITKQQEIIDEYNTIKNRISLNNSLIRKLEETAQAMYREWFVDFEFPDETQKVQLSEYVEFNPSYEIINRKNISYIEMSDLQENSMVIKNKVKRPLSGGSRFQNNDTLLARITPCLENGKTGFVNILEDGEVGFGSTEFIVMHPKENISPYLVYCISRDENFRSHAISSMIGSSGRQRVHSDYLKNYLIHKFNKDVLGKFHMLGSSIFNKIKEKHAESIALGKMKDLILSKMASEG